MSCKLLVIKISCEKKLMHSAIFHFCEVGLLGFWRTPLLETLMLLFLNLRSQDFNKVEKGHHFYDFQFNTRLVKSTIVHFQVVWSPQDFIKSCTFDQVTSYLVFSKSYYLATSVLYILLRKCQFRVLQFTLYIYIYFFILLICAVYLVVLSYHSILC